jgi:DNA primase catalytic core
VVISTERPEDPSASGAPVDRAAQPRGTRGAVRARQASARETLRAFIDEVRRATRLVDVIAEDVALVASGNVLKGLSPFNKEKTPSFVVWPDTETWHDFSGGGPGRGGDVFDYVALREGLSFKEALFKLAARYGIRRPGQDDESFQRELARAAELRRVRALLTEAAAYYHTALPTKIRARYYREHYGFTDETIDGLRLGWANGHLFEYFTAIGVGREEALRTGLFVVAGGAGPVHDFFRDRLVFPYWKGGQVAYFIARRTELTGDEDFEQAKYKKLLTRSERHPYVSRELVNETFYNEDAARGASELVITEGVTDCISAWQAAVPCISPVTTRFRDEDTPRLLSLTRKATRILVCNDAEASGAGAAGALVTAELLHAEGRDVRIVVLPRPEGVDKVDLNEYLKAHSAEEFRALAVEARPYVDHLIDQVPRDIAPAELEARLAPVLAALARGSPLEQDRYGKLIRKRFNLRERTVKTLLARAQGESRAGEHARADAVGEGAAIVVLPGAEHRVQDTVPELPSAVGPDARMPRGWAVREGALYEVRVRSGEAGGADYSLVARGVVLPTKITQTELGEFVSLAFQNQESPGWKTLTAPRETLATARLIVTLASQSFPVTSNEAAALVRFIADYVAANDLVRATGRTSCGWIDARTFLLGTSVVGERSIELVLHPDDEIGARIVEAIGARGNEVEHMKVLAEAVERSKAVALGLALSFAAPYLEPCDLPSVGLQFYGMGGLGKTSAMRLCMSPWGFTGDASRTTAGGVIRPATGTPKSLLDSARVTSGLPFAAVDINADLLASRYARDQMAHVAQCLVDGTGLSVKRRSGFGNRTGGSWRSTVLLDGEVPVGELASREGLGRRFLQVAAPFIDEGAPRDLAALATRAAEHYGYSGRSVVERLADLGDAERRRIHARYESHLKDLWDAAGVDREPYVSWARGVAVALAVAEEVDAVAGFGLGDVWTRQILGLWQALVESGPASSSEDETHASELERAKRCLIDLVASVRGRLLTLAGTIPIEATNLAIDWCGKIEAGAEDDIEAVALRTGLVRDALKRAEHSPGSVIRELAQAGFIRRPETAQGRRGALTVERRLRGVKVPCYVLELE